MEKALAFVKQSNLRGGTDLEGALTRGLDLAASGEAAPYLVLISDGGARPSAPFRRRASPRNIPRPGSDWRPNAARELTFSGSATMPICRCSICSPGTTAWSNGFVPPSRSIQIGGVPEQTGQAAGENLKLTTTPKEDFRLIYPLDERFFPGSMASWVGEYSKPGNHATFIAGSATAQVTLPAQNLDHPQLPRTWAKARVDALLAKIDREGEDRASIDEIIRLSREFKFVTPYTSFLAAPRRALASARHPAGRSADPRQDRSGD